MSLAFWKNITSWAGFALPGLKDNFFLHTQSYILLDRYWVYMLLMLSTTENSELSSANNLTSLCKPWSKSLI